MIISISVNLNVLSTEYSKEPSFDNPLHVFNEKKIHYLFFYLLNRSTAFLSSVSAFWETIKVAVFLFAISDYSNVHGAFLVSKKRCIFCLNSVFAFKFNNTVVRVHQPEFGSFGC